MVTSLPGTLRAGARRSHRLQYVVGRLDGHYTPEEVRIWLYSDHPQLNGKRAIDLIINDRMAEVIAILDRLDAEAYL